MSHARLRTAGHITIAISQVRSEDVPAFPSDEHVEAVARIAPALATIALGVVVLFTVGFLQTPAVHNGTHDARHANGFPCH